MHRLPRLSALNWLRLALIPAGGDWRDLPESVRLEARPGRQNGGFGVEEWAEPAHAVVAEGTVRNTRASVADPRVVCGPRNGAYGMAGFGEPAGTVLAAAVHDNGPFSVADPRPTCEVREGSYGVTGWDQTSTTVIAAPSPHNGPWQVADPRIAANPNQHNGCYGVSDWKRPSPTVTGQGRPDRTWVSTADPRPEHTCRRGSYGVQDDGAPAPTVIGESNAFHGQNVRDPRGAKRGVLWIDRDSGALVGPAEVLARFDVTSRRPMADPPIIIAADGTWHRPMTTLELAALQALPVRHGGDWLVLDGASHKDWRQRVGNAVPVATAEAIAETALRALLAADAGVWELGGEGVWVERGEEAHAA